MKLYFYILDRPLREAPKLRCEGCEVKDYPKTYKPLEKFPMGYYGSYIRKSDIGRVIGLSQDVVVLLDRNDDFAKRKFIECYERLIEEHQNKIDRYKSYVEAALRFGGDNNV